MPNIEHIHEFSIDIENRELFLHSYLNDSEEGGVDYRSAVIFEKNLRYLNQISRDPILVHMHLPGGDWQDCLGIYDAIRFSKSRVTILAYSKAESSSSVLFQAANTRVLMPNANMLIHYGSISIDSEHTKAASSSIQWNERESDKMVDIFVDRCMLSPIAKEKNWKKLMAKKHIVSQLASKCDWILTAEEAVYYGFADGILGSKRYPSIDSLKPMKKK
jgi:ATP-dependent protease ClpP protease subunit